MHALPPFRPSPGPAGPTRSVLPVRPTLGARPVRPLAHLIRLGLFALFGLCALSDKANAQAPDLQDIRARTEAIQKLSAPLYRDCEAKEVAYEEMTPQSLLEGIPGVIPGRARGLERKVRVAWTGGCTDGKLDGQGSLEIHQFTAPGTPFASQPLKFREAGLMVRGRRVGPWLIENSPSAASKGAYQWFDGPMPGTYIKLADGAMQLATTTWENGQSLKPVTTSLPIAAAEVARLTELARQAALQDGAPRPQRLPYRSALLADLFRNGEIFRTSAPKLVDAKTSTIAVILSARTEQSMAAIDTLNGLLARWSQSRAEPALTQATQRLIKALDGKAFTQGLVDLLRERFGKVVFAQDLAEVDRKTVRYVMIFDLAFQHGGQAMIDEWVKDASTPREGKLHDYFNSVPAKAMRLGFNYFLLDAQFDVMVAQEKEAAALGISRPNPYLLAGAGVNKLEVARALTDFINMNASWLVDRLGGQKFRYVDGKREDNFYAETWMLRGTLDELAR